MSAKYLIFIVFVFSKCSIHSNGGDIENAKWFYYSYAVGLDVYSREGAIISPLTCDLELNSTKLVNADTTKYYFSLHCGSSCGVCNLKPLDLVGIEVIRNKIYLPIYHNVIFDAESDSIVTDHMERQNVALLNKVTQGDLSINNWLREAARNRGGK